MIDNIDINTKQIELNEVLTKKNFKFIQYLSNGIDIQEAYKLAGYSGTNEQQAYQLKHKLKYKIAEYLRIKGFNQETLAVELSKIMQLPLREDQRSVTIDQKIKMIRLLKDCLPESEKKEPTFSRFTVINNIQSGHASVKTVDMPDHSGHASVPLQVIDVAKNDELKDKGVSNA